MQRKTFSKLTDGQKSKVQDNLNKAVKRIIDIVSLYEYFQNDDKKKIIFDNTVDIYYYQYSNIITKESYQDNLKVMLKYLNIDCYSNKM